MSWCCQLAAFPPSFPSSPCQAVLPVSLNPPPPNPPPPPKVADDVAELKIDLAHTLEVVAEKVEATDKLLVFIAKEKEGASVQEEFAQSESDKAAIASAEAAEIQANAETELSAAKPAMEAAANAVDCLEKSMLTELKSLPKPPSGVDMVTNACLILITKEYVGGGGEEL